MASQSLYRKWRSQTFGELVGQELIMRTLKNALTTNKLAHAYLFTGPRGTGKTTTARLLAKTINCANPVAGEPCNQCQQCREITAGNSFNVFEIDAASNRGIDSIRDLREKIMVPPSTGKYKVYVLDEAHMLTPEAFNALLKTLEEPPAYAVFVLATTDVHKMLPTVLSRCQRCDFKRITTRQIVKHVLYIAGEEHIKLAQGAAELIARAAAGGMRDALSLLDQARAYAGDEIGLEHVQAMLGVADPRAVHKLIARVAELESAAVLHLIHELSEAGADLRQLNAQVGEYWRALMLAKAGADIASILDFTEDEVRDILAMMPHFALAELTEFARIFAQNELAQKSQGTPQLGLELAFLQAIELHHRARSGQLPGAAAATPPATPPSPPVASQRTAQTAVPIQARHDIAPPAKPVAAAREREESPQSQPPVSPLSQVAADGNSDTPETVGRSGPSLTFEQVSDSWESVKKRVKQKNPQTAALLKYCNVTSVEGTPEQTIVVIQASNEVFHERMNQSERLKYVEWALNVEFGQKCRVTLANSGESVTISSAAAVTYSYAVTAPQPRPEQQPAEQNPSLGSVVEEATPTVRTPVKEPPIPAQEPVAKKNMVRENMTTEVARPAQDILQQKVSDDPVLKEIVRTFGAKIVEIHPK